MDAMKIQLAHAVQTAVNNLRVEGYHVHSIQKVSALKTQVKLMDGSGPPRYFTVSVKEDF